MHCDYAGQLASQCKVFEKTLDQFEKITAAFVENTDGNRKFHHEITIQLKSDIVDDSVTMFVSAVLAAYKHATPGPYNGKLVLSSSIDSSN
jgi:hypothetical protein